MPIFSYFTGSGVYSSNRENHLTREHIIAIIILCLFRLYVYGSVRFKSRFVLTSISSRLRRDGSLATTL